MTFSITKNLVIKIFKKKFSTNNNFFYYFLYSGLNFQDLLVRLGAIDSPPKTPCILGFECSGEIEAIGEEVEDFKVGDRIVALPEFRAWAELVAVPAKYVYKIPDEMSFTDAAAIAMNYLVAYILLFDLASIKSGKSILLHSAGGGVVSTIFIFIFLLNTKKH